MDPLSDSIEGLPFSIIWSYFTPDSTFRVKVLVISIKRDGFIFFSSEKIELFFTTSGNLFNFIQSHGKSRRSCFHCPYNEEIYFLHGCFEMNPAATVRLLLGSMRTKDPVVRLRR